ncbi:MAG: hypothetical protein WAT39_07915 [Planctomycetota bacterium]
MFRPLACVSVALAVMASIPCQSAGLLEPAARFVHAWPESGGAAGLQPVAARLCRFDAASECDAVLLRAKGQGTSSGSRSLVVMRGVAAAHACVPLADAIDFVVVPVAAGAQGVIALATNGALRLYRWPAGQAAPTSQEVGTWHGCKRLAAVGKGKDTELFGFGACNHRIQRATWSGAGLRASSAATVSAQVDAIEAIDWDRDGNPELVFATPAGLFVQQWNLAPVAVLPLLPGASISTCVSHAATAGDLLVAVLWDGTQSALVWANAATQGIVLLGNHRPGPITVYDRDGDGDEDVLIGDAQHSVVRVLVREVHGWVQLAAPLLTGSAAPDAGIGAVCGGDLDGDGDGEVLAWNDGTLRLHSLFDATRVDPAPLACRAEVTGAVSGTAVALPVVVDLPELADAGDLTFALRLTGWLVDPVTGFVQPQRVVDSELAIETAATRHETTLTFPLPAACQGRFHLQLRVGLVAVADGGERRCLPPMVVHVTNDLVQELAIRAAVEQELTGSVGKPGDGGGDGNILGSKTGKHQIGVPPR